MSKNMIVYSYGALAPTRSLDLVRCQLRLCNQYRNDLAQQEIHRRERYHATMQALFPEVARLAGECEAAEGELEALTAQASAERKKTRSRKVGGALAATITEVRQRLKVLRQEYKVARTAASASQALKDAIASVEEQTGQARRDLRAVYAERGLFWGSYILVEQDARRFMQGPPPRFKKYRGDGRLGVQIQHLSGKPPFTTEDLFGDDNRVRIEDVTDYTRMSARRAERGERYVNVWLRVGSSGRGNREPVWAVVPVYMHRPLPKGANVKFVYLTVRRTATVDRWSVQFVLDTGEPLRENNSPLAVAVDLGWRLRGEGEMRPLRVATWCGEDGDHGEVSLPPRLVNAWGHADELHSIRDTLFNQVKLTLAAWLAGAAAPQEMTTLRQYLTQQAAREDTTPARQQRMYNWLEAVDRLVAAWPGQAPALPETVTAALDGVALWKSQARLVAALRLWGTHTIEHPHAMVEFLRYWGRQDRHLFDWEMHERRYAANRRQDIYRKLSAVLARKYGTVILEDTNWREISEKPEVAGGEDRSSTTARYYQRAAAPGTLALCLAQRLRPVKVNPKDSTKECHHCGSIEQWDQGAEVEHTCGRCGRTWDQDHNAAINLLRRGLAAREEKTQDAVA